MMAPLTVRREGDSAGATEVLPGISLVSARCPDGSAPAADLPIPVNEMTTGGAAAEPTPRDPPAASAAARPVMPRQFTPAESATESARLAELHSLGILDTPPEPGFDDLVTLAAQITGCPIALV